MMIDNGILEGLLGEAEVSPRLRANRDMRTSSGDRSQRMLNALLPSTEVPIHRHPQSAESVICLRGRMDEILYDDNGVECARISLCPAEGRYGCQVPAGAWHTVEVYEPSVIFEAKDGAFGSDGSETMAEHLAAVGKFVNSFGDLRKNIEYLIGMERMSGSMEVITPIYVSRMLNIPLPEVEAAMKEMNLTNK